MSVTALEFLNSARLSEAVLAALTRVVEVADGVARHLVKHFEPARPKLVSLSEDLRRLQQSPPVSGYEALLIGRGHHPLAARILGLNLPRLAGKHLEELKARRKLASAVYALVAAGHATPLVISRRAKAIAAALDDGVALPSLGAACAEAHIAETDYPIRELLERATGRDAAACSRLIEVCVALKPHLAEPRGLMPGKASAMHELLLRGVEQAYTYDPIKDDFTDPATRATCAAMNIERFDPRPAHRRRRMETKGRGQGQPRLQ